MSELTPLLSRLKDFHGHLGPYVVAGHRMGLAAREALQGRLYCEVHCGSRPPLSCLIDGIQFSSGCTMGKGNIAVAGESEAKALFRERGGASVSIELRPELRQRIDEEMGVRDEEEAAIELSEMSDEELFLIG